MPCTIQVCTNSRRPAFCWKWTQRSVLLLLLIIIIIRRGRDESEHSRVKCWQPLMGKLGVHHHIPASDTKLTPSPDIDCINPPLVMDKLITVKITSPVSKHWQIDHSMGKQTSRQVTSLPALHLNFLWLATAVAEWRLSYTQRWVQECTACGTKRSTSKDRCPFNTSTGWLMQTEDSIAIRNYTH